MPAMPRIFKTLLVLLVGSGAPDAEAGVTPAGGGFAVTLDGKPIKTPSGRVVTVPAPEIADAISAEWEAQKEIIDPLAIRLLEGKFKTGDTVFVNLSPNGKLELSLEPEPMSVH